jgi:hypothetical protein
MSNQLSQLPIEVAILSSTPISLRISQLPIETAILSSAPISLRLSQLPIEVAVGAAPVSVETVQFIIMMS